jgi:acetoin:2,6-dichlorophenolindophenol oxidoreductase subunit beta
VTYAKTVGTGLQAAETLAAEGVSAEVIDLRTLKPLDVPTVLGSLRKTGRLVVVHEASGLCGVAAEIAAIAAEKAFDSLKGPVVRVNGPDAPAASSWVLEQAGVPQPQAVCEAVRRLVAAPLGAPVAA